MGRLHELLKEKVQDSITKKYTSPQDKDDIEEQDKEIKKYNQTWLLKISNMGGYIVNSDREKAQKILDALNRRNGQCPCGGDGKQYQCPCFIMREHGICKCGLFENIKRVEPKGKSTARIKVDE